VGLGTLRAAGLLGTLLLLEVVPRAAGLGPEVLPPLSRVLRALGLLLADGGFWGAVGQTLLAWALGLGAAVVLGTALGLAVGAWPPVERATRSTLDFLRAVPPVVLVPVLVLVVPVGLRSAALLAAYSSIWIILLQVAHGLGSTDRVARDTARTLRLTRWQRWRHLVLPTVLPWFATGLRLASSVALALVVTAGLVMGGDNLGRALWSAQSGGAVDEMSALLLVIGLLGVLIAAVLRAGERRVLHWHESVRVGQR